MNDLSIEEMKSQIEISNGLLEAAEKEIERLKAQANFSSNQQYKTYQKILSENHQLEKYHQNNINDLQNYKKQL